MHTNSQLMIPVLVLRERGLKTEEMDGEIKTHKGRGVTMGGGKGR